MSTAAISSANIAISQAQKKSACANTLQTYEPTHATVSQMQSYAKCVNTLYPHQQSPEVVLVAKFAVIFVFLGMTGMCLYKYRHRSSRYSLGDFLDSLVYGFIVSGLSVIGFFLFVVSIIFLFS